MAITGALINTLTVFNAESFGNIAIGEEGFGARTIRSVFVKNVLCFMTFGAIRQVTSRSSLEGGFARAAYQTLDNKNVIRYLRYSEKT